MTTTIPEDASYQATLEQIAELRTLVDEPTEDPYTNAILGTLIDASEGNLTVAARTVWVQKAARLSRLVDIREGNSDRKLSQLQKQALLMVERFTVDVEEAAPTRRGSRTRRIDRQ